MLICFAVLPSEITSDPIVKLIPRERGRRSFWLLRVITILDLLYIEASHKTIEKLSGKFHLGRVISEQREIYEGNFAREKEREIEKEGEDKKERERRGRG